MIGINRNLYCCKNGFLSVKPIRGFHFTKNIITSVIAGVLLVACSNSGSNGSAGGGNGNGNVSSLQIITPKIIYSKSDGVGSSYVVINNSTNAAVKNLHYSLNVIGGASGADIDPASAANCATVAANSQCTVKITVSVGAVAGSLGLDVSNDSSLLGRLTTAAKATAPTPTIGVEQTAYNNLSGADGITLSYYHTVINGTPYVLVSGLVASNNAGTFNKIVLVNGSGTELANQVALGSINSSQGSTFNILLPVPSGNNASQTIKVQTQQLTNGQAMVVSTSTASSTLTTKENIGIAEMLPSAVYLTESNPEQIITFANTGDAVAQLQQLTSNNPNVEIVFSPSSLNSGTTATATLRLKDKTVAATSGNIILTYNNGQGETATSATVDQNVNPTPTPSPSPAPTPTPPVPAPTPTAGLTAVFSPDSDFFKTSAGAAVSRQLTLTNIGNTDENAIILTLPANFTISAGSSNSSCTVTQGTSPATLSDTLSASGGNCTVTVTYSNNSVVDPAQTANISIAYSYNNGQAAIPTTAAGVNYRVTQSTANLSLQSPANPFSFPTTLVDGANTSEKQLFTLINSGEIDAIAISGVVNTTAAGLFSATSTDVTDACGATLAPNATCEYGVQFGFIPDNTGAGSKSGNLTVSYKTYPAATTIIDLLANFSGQVANSGSAIFNAPESTIGVDFSGSMPSLSIAQNATGAGATIAYTITNTGGDAATNFVIILPNIPAGWNAPTTDCPTMTGSSLAVNGSCQVEITPDTSQTTTINAINMEVSLAWSDQASPIGDTQTLDIALPQVVVLPPPAAIIIASTTDWGQIMMGNAYSFSATITGGSSTVTPTVTGITGNTLSPASCDLNSAAPATSSCIFKITPYTGSGNYSFWHPTNIANSTNPAIPSVIYTNSGINLTVTASNSATVNGVTSPQSFSNISGTVIAPYVYLPQTGQTPSVPLDVTSITGADGNVHAGIPWVYGSSGSTAPNPRFVDNGCDITDNLTGLIWVKNLSTVNSGATLDWETALATANAGTWCSQSAGTWRVPNINELNSLVNYARINQAIEWLNVPIANDGGGFSNVQPNGYWSSSSYASNTVHAWRVIMGNGSIMTLSKSSATNRLFPVRNGQ